jgi:hypothetical protein
MVSPDAAIQTDVVDHLIRFEPFECRVDTRTTPRVHVSV